jgi:hypothetical protein
MSALEIEDPYINLIMKVKEIDQTITDLAQDIGTLALSHHVSVEFSPVIGNLVKARRALREAFEL